MSCTRQGYLLMIFNISTDFNIFISSLDSLFRCPPPTHTHKKQQVLNTSVLSEPLENQVIMESCGTRYSFKSLPFCHLQKKEQSAQNKSPNPLRNETSQAPIFWGIYAGQPYRPKPTYLYKLPSSTTILHSHFPKSFLLKK